MDATALSRLELQPIQRPRAAHASTAGCGFPADAIRIEAARQKLAILIREPSYLCHFTRDVLSPRIPMTLIMRPAWPFEARCEKNRPAWQLVHPPVMLMAAGLRPASRS